MRTVYIIVIVVAIALAVGLFTTLTPRRPREGGTVEAPKTIIVYSEAFENGGRIPKKYTKEGEDVSPPLRWSNAPEDTKCYVVVVVDPDAPMGPFIHWVLYNIPATVMSLPEGIPKTPVVEGIGMQGVNDYGEVGYGGPYPPPGTTHRYIFRVYALDTTLTIGPGARLEDVMRMMEGHVIAYGELVGTYSR